MLISAVDDLSVRRRAETHLEQLEARYRALLEAAPDAMVVVDEAGVIVLVNAQAEQQFGYHRNELLGQKVTAIIPQGFAERLIADGARTAAVALAQQIGTGIELSGLRRDGSEFPIEIMLSPLQSAEGILVTAAIRNITERKKAEELRFHLAAIVDSSEDAIIGADLTGRITSWNRGAERIFGYTAREAIGEHTSLLLPLGRTPEELAIVERLHKGESGRSFDTVRRRKDGRELDVSLTISPIHDSRDNLVGTSKVARDITARKRAEAALARAKDAAEVAVQELESFSYSVAHDLRAPLRGIDGFSQILLEQYSEKLDADGRRYLRRVSESAHHMAELIESLLTLARVTQTDTRLESVNLSDLVRASAARLRDSHPERQVEVHIANDITHAGDSRLLGVAFDNLLGNAWKFTRRNPAARIEFGCAVKNEANVYFVSDNGAGFDMAFSAKLFGVFQRLHAASEFEGTGIGLATVQRIIRRHGGQVWAEGKVGDGATFYFTLNDLGEPK